MISNNEAYYNVYFLLNDPQIPTDWETLIYTKAMRPLCCVKIVLTNTFEKKVDHHANVNNEGYDKNLRLIKRYLKLK